MTSVFRSDTWNKTASRNILPGDRREGAGCGGGQAFAQATTGSEGEVAPLQKYLEGAGLSVTRILLLDVITIEQGPPDTMKTSVSSRTPPFTYLPFTKMNVWSPLPRPEP